MYDQQSLFSKSKLQHDFDLYKRQISSKIDSFSPNYLLSVNIEDLLDHIIDEYRLEPLRMFSDKVELVDKGDTLVPTNDFGRRIDIDGNFYVFSVPFTGDPNLFHRQASTFTYSPKPCGTIKGSELQLRLTSTDYKAEELKKSLDREIDEIQQYIGWINNDIARFNNSLKTIVERELKERKEKHLKDQGLVASLGIPIRQRKDAPKTFVAPVTRKKIHIPKPKASSTPYKPEPELELNVYEQILDTLRNMVFVMERSPHAFTKIQEEGLRTHFLVQLNGLYEGQATGETFNFEGKTDILIRVDGRNIFIAECKFWGGPKVLQKTIDQLLGYLSWRDTKVAILIFNRNKELGKVLEQIPDAVKDHPNYKKNFEQKEETEFRFVLKSNIDNNRELISTILVFDIPK